MNFRLFRNVVMCFLFFLSSVSAQEKATVLSTLKGTASYYAKKFQGRKTTSGERFDNEDYTCANPNLPFGTYVRVTNLSNQKSVVVRVNDRLRQRGNHIIDLSQRAASDIDLIFAGRCSVKVEVLDTDYALSLNRSTIYLEPIRRSVMEPFPTEEWLSPLPKSVTF